VASGSSTFLPARPEAEGVGFKLLHTLIRVNTVRTNQNKNGGWVSPTRASQGIPQRMGRGTTTETVNLEEHSRHLLQRHNLLLRNPGMCCSQQRSTASRVN
jgi:hypothetical protein